MTSVKNKIILVDHDSFEASSQQVLSSKEEISD